MLYKLISWDLEINKLLKTKTFVSFKVIMKILGFLLTIALSPFSFSFLVTSQDLMSFICLVLYFLICETPNTMDSHILITDSNGNYFLSDQVAGYFFRWAFFYSTIFLGKDISIASLHILGTVSISVINLELHRDISLQSVTFLRG